MATVTELLQPVELDLETLLTDLRSLIGAGHPFFKQRQSTYSVPGANAFARALCC